MEQTLARQHQLPLEIGELAACESSLTIVTAWLHQEWFGRAGLSLEKLQHRLARRRNPATLPRTLVAQSQGETVGTFSLIEETDPQTGLPVLCLANVFVPTLWRRRGIGALLCHAAAEEARRWQVAQLGLFTISHADYYAQLGWLSVCPSSVRSGGEWKIGTFMKRAVG